MNNNSTPKMAAKTIAIVISCCLFLVSHLNAQQQFCTWSGHSGNGTVTSVPCGAFNSGISAGSGTYSYINLEAGKTYTFEASGMTDAQLTLWHYWNGNGYANGNNGGWGPLSWGNDNGPTGAGAHASFTLTAPHTSGNYIMVVNRNNCNQHGCFTTPSCSSPYGSAILKYREEGNPTLTATANSGNCAGSNSVALSMGGTCNTHNITTGMYEQFNTASVALSYVDYSGRWTKGGDVFVDAAGQNYSNGSAGGAWGSAYQYTNQTVSRVEGRTVQGRFYWTGGIEMFGWHDGGTGGNFTDLVHAFYVHSNGNMYIYEDGADRGAVTTWANEIAGGFGTNRWIEFKIVLHSGAANNQGATYYLRGYNNGDVWHQVYHSNYSNESNLRFGTSIYNAPTFYLDDIFVGGAPIFPANTGLGEGTWTYAAQDQHGTVVTATASTTNSPPAPVAATQKPATNESCTTFTANWTASPNALRYYVDLSTSPSFTSYIFQNFNAGNVTSYNFSGMTAGTQYFYRVRAHNNCGFSPYNLNTQVDMLPASPQIPNVDPPSSITYNSFRANWTVNDVSATGYYIDISSSPSFTSNIVNNAFTTNNWYDLTHNTPGVNYYYRIRSTYACGTSTSSLTVPVEALPLAQTPLVHPVSIIGCNGFTLEWSPSTAADYYTVDLSTNAAFSSYVPGYQNLNVGSTTSYAFTGLSGGVTYYTRARAVNGGGASAPSPSQAVTLLPAIPTAPGAVAASGISCTSFTANWGTSANTDAYYLDISLASDFSSYELQNANQGTATSYVFAATAGNTYYYRVRAENVCGTSPSSTTVTVMMPAATPATPSVAGVIAATNCTATNNASFTPEWFSSANADNYYLEVSTVSTFASYVGGYNGVSVGNVTSVTISGLTPGINHFYRVKAGNSCGISAASATVTTLLPAAAPGTAFPQATATNIGCNQFDPRWIATARATGYYVDVATSPTFTTFVPGWNNTYVAGGTTTSVTVSGLNPGTAYSWRIRATNSCGTGGNSAARTTSTLPPAPASATANAATSIGCTSFTANWALTPTATAYYVDVSTNSDFSTFLAGWENRAFAVTNNSSVTGLTENATYYYRVRAGNTCGISPSSNTVTVTINGTPYFVSCPADVTVSNNASACDVVVTYPGAVLYSQPATTPSYSHASGSVFPLGTTLVTASATNICGSATPCTFNVSVIDQTAPTIVCPGDQILPLDAACSVAVPDYIRATSITDNCSPFNSGLPANQQPAGSITVVQTPATGTVLSGEGVHLITITATDSSGNTNSCSFNVTVEDFTAPNAVCQPLTVQLDGSGSGSLTAAQIDGGSSDNCTVASISATPTSFGCAEVGANDVTLTVTDIYGNSSACIANVTVEDNIAPVAVCQSITIQLDAAGSASISGTDIDGGSTDACGIATWVASPDAFTCANHGANAVTLTVTDVNGNASSCPATVTVEDNVAPDAVCQDITVQLDASGNASIIGEDVNNGSTDACGIASYSVSPNSFTCGNVGSNPVILTVTDIYSNASTCSATVTVEDNVDPVAVCQDITVQLDASGNGSLTAGDINNGSSDACGIATLDASVTSFNCSNVGANTVVLTATDVNGNSSTCNSNVTVEDNVAPVTIPQNITVQLDATGNVSIVGIDVDGGSTDACGIATYSVTPDAFTCANVGANNVVLTVTDVNGNSSSNSATVTVEDNVAPTAVCQDITIQLDASGNAAIVAADIDGGSNDACGVAGIAASQYTFNCSNVGANTVTLSVTDVNANNSSCNATVTVEDNVDPVTLCQDITIQLDAAGNASIVAADIDGGSNDACGIASLIASQYSFTCGNVGGNTVTLTSTDVNGNSSSCDATVTVEDNIAPIAICQDITVKLDTFGMTSIVAADIDGGSNDACGVATLAASQYDFSCAHVGINVVTLTVTDVNGNVTTCDAEVTVLDTIAPTAICQAVVAQLDASGNGSITPEQINFGSDDACGLQPLSVSPSTFDCQNVGANTVVLTVTDLNGNVSTCLGTVTVQDNVAPVAQCKPIDVYLDVTGNISFTGEDVDNGSSDACGIATLVPTPGSFTCANVGSNPVVLTVTDVNGNISTCSNNVTVYDTVAPFAICRPATIQLNNLGQAFLEPAQIDGGSNDACGLAADLVSKEEFGCEDVGQHVITLTVVDNNGNFSSCDALVTVEDKVPATPVCQNITVSLDPSGNVMVTGEMLDGGSTDNCGVADLESSVVNYSCANVGNNPTTLTVTDVNGNVSSCTSIVTVIDDIAPTAICRNVTVTLNSVGFASITAGTGAANDVDNGSYDNCGIATMTVFPNTFGCANIGSNAVTLTVTDVNGNVSTCPTTATVVGAIPTCFITAVRPAGSPYTGGVNTNIYLGYGNQTVTLQTTMNNGTPQFYSWTGQNLSCYNCAAPVFAPTATGVYNFTATITNNFGCVTTCNITICVLDIRVPGQPGKVYVAHVVNGNGNNSNSCNSLSVGTPSLVNAHLAHGDYLGTCAGSGTQICQGPTYAKDGDESEELIAESGDENFGVKVFPNPFSDQFRLNVTSKSTDNLNVRIYDVLGQLMMDNREVAFTSEIRFGSTLSKGVYLVEVSQGEKVSVIRVVKSE